MTKFKFFLIPLCCVLLAVTSFASSVGVYIFETDDEIIEVSFDENTAFSESQKQHIVDVLVFGEENANIQPYGLTCVLLGHDITTELVEVTYHKRKSTSPRCYMESYAVDTCSRCDYLSEELMGGVYVICCPED